MWSPDFLLEEKSHLQVAANVMLSWCHTVALAVLLLSDKTNNNNNNNNNNYNNNNYNNNNNIYNKFKKGETNCYYKMTITII